MTWTLFPVIIVLYMLGGQGEKWLRRYGVGGLVAIVQGLKGERAKDRTKALIFLLLIPLLSMGYGENSTLMKVLKKDWIVRIVYGALVGCIFLLFKLWWAPFALAIAYSIRAGGFKITDDIDFLWEDLIRGATLATLICLSIGG